MLNEETPLHLAAKWGNTEIVKKLIIHEEICHLRIKMVRPPYTTVYNRCIMKEGLRIKKSARNSSEFGIQ